MVQLLKDLERACEGLAHGKGGAAHAYAGPTSGTLEMSVYKLKSIGNFAN